jgi:hypothetical protein
MTTPGDQHKLPAKPRPEVESVDIPSDLSPDLQKTIFKDERDNARRGLIIGSLAILAGVILIILGATATVDLTFSGGDSEGHLITGSVGLVIALIGLAVIFFTRYRVKVRPAKSGPSD